MNQSELAALANRSGGSVPKYATEGVPVVSMRKEGEPTEWEDVFVFPDPERPYRRGFIGQNQDVMLGTNYMPMAAHTWEGQGEAFFSKAIGEFSHDTGALDAVDRKSNQIKTLQDVLDKLKKPGEDPDDSVQGGSVAKRKSTALGSGVESLPDQSPSESFRPSGLSKAVLGMFTSPRAQKSPRQPSPVTSEPPSKASKSNATVAVAPDSPAHNDSAVAPGSPGARSVTSATTCAFDLMLGDNDCGEDFLRKWKKTCPEELVLTDQVDGRSVEGLTRANRRLASLAEKDPLKQEAADKFNIFTSRVKHCQSHSISRIGNMSKAEVDAGLQKLQTYGITLPAMYELCLLSMAVKRDVGEKRHMTTLSRILPLSNGRALNPLDCFLGSIDCPIDDKVALFKKLASKMVVSPLVRSGQESASTVNSACEYILENFAKVDVVTADHCLVSCKTEADRCANFLTVLYGGIIDPNMVEDVLWVGSTAGQDDADESMTALISKAVAETEWWSERYSQYKRVTKYIDQHGSLIIELSHRVTSIGDADEITDDDLKVLAQAATLMASLASKMPIDNKEVQHFKSAIPPLLKKAYGKLLADHQQSTLTDASKFPQLEKTVQATREAFPDAQDVLWVEQHLEELKSEVMARGSFHTLQTLAKNLEKDGLRSASQENLTKFEELITPCLACDFDDNSEAKDFLEHMMASLLAGAFSPSSSGEGYTIKGTLINTASKILVLCRKSGTTKFDTLVDLARHIKCLSEALKEGDQTDIEQLYVEAEKDNFLLCKNLSAELKKMQSAKRLVDEGTLSSIANLPFAFTDFETRSMRIVSEVYGRRKASLKEELDKANSSLSDMVLFGDGKDTWSASLHKDAKQDAVFTKASNTCLKIPIDDLIAAIDRLSQAGLDLLGKAQGPYKAV